MYRSGDGMRPISPISARRFMLTISEDASSAQGPASAASPFVSFTPSSGKHHGSERSVVIAVAVAVPIVLIIVLPLVCYCCVLRFKRNNPLAYERGKHPGKHVDFFDRGNSGKIHLVGAWLATWPSRSFSSVSTPPKVWLPSAYEMQFSRLQSATDNFSQANILGEGGSARVYKARLESDTFAAVKMIESNGQRTLAEFKAEVDLMRQVRHPNLVSLLGYCQQGHHCILVYEFMQFGSLDDQLYGPDKGAGLSWNMRMKIALESARGLEHLHGYCVPTVVHRDFKASNILLNSEFQAKVSDFGLATPLEGLTREQSMQLIGTIGYIAPEFFASGALTEKSDVYAFGVTLLELLTGRKPVDHSLPPPEQSLINWARPQLTDRQKLPLLADPHIRPHLSMKHLYQVAAIAALCVQTEPHYRPLMTDVVQSLLPLVPVELGGALRREAVHHDGTASNSYSDSRTESRRVASQVPNVAAPHVTESWPTDVP